MRTASHSNPTRNAPNADLGPWGPSVEVEPRVEVPSLNIAPIIIDFRPDEFSELT